MTAMTGTAPTKLERRSREALSALAVQFLLGMGLNLLPTEDSGGGLIVDGILFVLHVLVGIGVVVVAVRLLVAARADGVGRTEALWGLVVVALTFVIGVLTVITGSEWLSFLMAAGFAVSAALYVRTLLLGAAHR